MPTVAPKEKPVVKRGKVERADTYLGVASKVLTIVAALSTLSIWLYSSYFVGTLEVKPDRPVQSLTLKLYDERGVETIYHTGRVKVVPGHYQIIATADDSAPARCEADVKFNDLTVVPYVVPLEQSETVSEEAKSEEKSNRRWWQIWKRD